MDYEGDAPQEYEQIPWSHLVPVQKDRSMQLALIVVVAVAVLLAGLFVLRRSPDPAPIALATSVAPVPVAAPPTEPVAAVPEPAPVASLPEPQIYSEADLMAVLPPPRGDLEMMAVARAELFVADYFTIDGDAGLAERISDSFPDAVDLPDNDGSRISYVEWVRAVDVSQTDRGAYLVTVWFRTLVGDESGGFTRTDVRAVDVELQVDDLGRLAVADLPAVTPVASAGIADAWPDPVAPPQEIVGAAAESLAAFGSFPELTAAGKDEDGWRLLFAVGDASGLRFPLVVRVPPER